MATITVCEDCGFEVKCKGCHSFCQRCAGIIRDYDYVEYKLRMQAIKDGDNNKT